MIRSSKPKYHLLNNGAGSNGDDYFNLNGDTVLNNHHNNTNNDGGDNEVDYNKNFLPNANDSVLDDECEKFILKDSSKNINTNTNTTNRNKKIDDGQQADESLTSSTASTSSASNNYKVQIVWRNIFLMLFLHTASIYGGYLFTFHATIPTMIFTVFTIQLFGLGITCGAHRLWSHRSYEASLPLRIFLMILNSSSLQNDIYEWSRDHRVHHKFSETDADPHNSNRGFFFAHIGWLLCKKHPDVFTKGKTISMADLERDPVVRFQRKFYKPLAVFFTFYLPAYIPYLLWNENLYTAFFVSLFRYCLSLHFTWLVNSAAHMYGVKPYDQKIQPVESKFVMYATIGEGYHNYHHVFPYDYSASEMGWGHNVNISTLFIDCCVWLGLAKNCKKVDPNTIQNRIKRTGDEELAEVYRQKNQLTQQASYRRTIGPLLFILFVIPGGFYLLRLIVFAIGSLIF